MSSLIIQEHNEGRTFVQKMLEQAAKLPMQKEVIYVTSTSLTKFQKDYGPFDYGYPVQIIDNIQSCGEARNRGGNAARGDTLLYMDSHVCFKPDMVDRLLQTLNQHQNAIVAPAIQAIEFPSCEISGGLGHGVYFRFNKIPFEWVWEPALQTREEFKTPFVCGCAFSIKKNVFNILTRYGGFLSGHTGLSWEEEKSMRLWRLGYPTYIEPRATFGHLYKGYANHPKWDDHSTSGYYETRIAGFYVNVFNKDLWNHIEKMLINSWGNEYYKYLEKAKKDYTWLRNAMQPYANTIDENWFLRKT